MILQKYLFESAKYASRSYPIIKPYINEVERLYSLSRQELSHRNEQCFLQLFQRAYDKSPFYHQLYSQAGIARDDITCLDDIVKLPVVTKEMVRQHASHMVTVPQWQLFKAHTSGTTGSPLSVFHSWHSIWSEQAYNYCARQRNGFTYGQPLVSLRGHLDHRTTHLTVHASNTLYLSSYCLNNDNIALYHDKILHHKPIAIEGYPSSLFSLALLLKENNLQLHIPVAFTSSETLLDYQRKLIEKQLNTQVFDNYGLTEQCIFLQENNNHTGYYELPGYSINEYLDDGVLCTSLINNEFPLIRYKCSDLMQLCPTPDNNTSSTPDVVKRINGRLEDYIQCKDGTVVQRLDFLFKGVRHVKLSQLVQTKKGALEIRIVPEADFSDDDRLTIEQNLANRLGHDNIDFITKLIPPSEIIYTSQGKFSFIVNRSR